MRTAKRTYTKIVTFLFIVLFLATVMGLILPLQKVEASTALSTTCYYLDGKYSLRDGGKNEFHNYVDTDYYYDNHDYPMSSWVKVGISNGTATSESSGKMNIDTYVSRAKNITISVESLKGQGKDDHQHLYSATLYKDNAVYKTAGSSSDLKGGSKHTIFSLDNPPSGTYYVVILYSVDKGWRVPVPGVGWIGFRYESVKFTINNNAPSFTAKPENNSIVSSTTLRVSSSNGNRIYLNGTDVGYVKTVSSSNYKEGKYSYYASDDQGNSTDTYSFYLDYTAPTGSLYNVANGGVTNNSVYFAQSTASTGAGSTAKCCSDDVLTMQYKLNGGSWQSYSNRSLLSAEGSYQIKITDKAGNSSTYSFEIDKTAPTGTLSGVVNGGITNQNVSFSWTDTRATATLDGKPYSKGAAISAEGSHTIKLTDSAGNYNTYTFEIDKTAPLPSIYTSSGSIVIDGNVVNKDVYFTWNDARSTAKYKINSGEWQVYWQSYYCNRDFPNIKYQTRTEALNAITASENKKVSEIASWDGTGSVYSGDTQYAQVGKKCWKYNELYFFQESSLSAYKQKQIDSLLQNVTKNLLSESGNYTIELTDTAGNKTTRTFTIDKTPPTGTLSGVTDGGVTNSSVTFSWNEDGATATLDNKTYNKGTAIDDEGRHVIILTDKAGNSTTYTFEIDLTAPTGTLNGLTNEEFKLSNGTVTFSWNEAGATATLDSKAYNKGTAITAAGKHTIILTDRAGNSTTYTFTIDKTSPVGTLSPVTEGGITNKNVTFSWEEEGATATLNGKTYNKGTAISAEGYYTVILTDRAGNSTTYTFEIDLTAPTGTLRGVSNNGVTNGTVTFSWKEEGATATLNGEPYTKDSVISDAGEHTIVLTDKAGNSTNYTFEIDLTAPTGSLSGVTDGGITNSSVTFSWNDEGATAKLTFKLSTTAIQNNSSFTAEGKYTIILTDRAGNSTTYTFEIDKTAPTGTLRGVSNNGVTNKNVTFSWEEEGATATLNDEPYTSGTPVAAEGSYTVKLRDKAGNSTTYTFEIDLTAPTGTLDGVENEGITNKNVFFSWEEEGATATLDGNNLLNGSGISAAGKHTIILTDRAGNSTTYTFEIDLTAPTGTLDGVTDGGVTNKVVKFTWSEGSATATLDDAPYTSGTSVSAEGKHTIVLTDRAGNATTYTFEIDLTAPTGTLRGVSNNGVTNGNVTFSWEEEGATATINKTAYTNNSLISAEGKYVIVLTDRAGNSTTYTFEIDLTAPTGTLDGVTDGGSTNKVVKFTWSESTATATLNNTPYTKETEIRAEGKYTIILTDRAGNSTTYTFEIDLTAPTGGFSQSGNIVEGIEYFNIDVSFSWNEDGAHAEFSLNDSGFKSYKKDTLLKDEGNYKIKLYDACGNIATYNFVIDKTAYTNNKDFIMSEYVCHINKWYETYSYKFETDKYIQNVTYSFTNYDDTLRYAINRERGIVEEHAKYEGGNIFCDYASRYVDGTDVTSTSSMLGQPYYIYKDANNPSKLIAYFKVSNLEVAINKYAEKSVSLKYLPNTPATPFPGDSYISAQEIYRDQIYIQDTSFTLPYRQKDGYLYINGRLAEYTQKLTPGLNVIREVDYAGNETQYTITLDTEAPKFVVEDAVGNILSDYEELLNSERTEFYFDKEIKLSLLDNYDENCLLTITIDGATSNIIGTAFELNKSGIYTFTVRDIAGNTKKGTIYLSLIPPTITIKENLTVQGKLESFEVSISKNLAFNSITSISVQRKDYDSDEYTLLSQDDIGVSIKNNTLNYKFVSNGDYIITVIDNYYRETVYNYSFFKDAPVGTLYSRGGSILKNGSVTNQDVYFAWADETCIAYYIFGEEPETEYPLKQYLSQSGKYTIILRDIGGNESKYTFEIDKTAPNSGRMYYIDENTMGEIDIPNKSKTNRAVYFTYDKETEKDAIVRYTLNSTGKWILYTGEKLTLDGSYLFELTDKAGNTSTYQFSIDTVAPVVTIQTSSNQLLNNNAITNKPVKFIYEENNVIAKVNNETYTSGTLLRNAGTYSFYIEDACGNFATYFVTIDLTAPTGTLEGVQNSGFTKNNVTLSWTEEGLTLLINGKEADKSVISSKTITIDEEGTYELTLKDLAGNATSYTFTIDKTSPVGTLSPVTEGGITNKNVTFTWGEGSATATLDGEPYTSGTTIRTEGRHVIVLTDRAGNSTTYTFEIDLTAPTGTLDGVTDGGVTNKVVKFTWSEDGATATINSISYASGSEIRIEGKYKIILTDRAGNSTTYTFEIDKTAPTGTLDGVQEGGVTNKNVTFTWSGSSNTATLDDAPYTSGATIRTEGRHVIILTDRAGNSTTYTFEIDKTAPTGTLNGLTNEEFKLSNGTVTFSWEEEGVTATLNGALYKSGTAVTAAGKHTIILTDRAGNSTTYTFEIDLTAPTGTLDGVQEGDVTNKVVKFTWSEGSATATLDDAPYTSGTSVSAEGKHTIVLTDRAGNSTTYTFEIDLTAPTGTLDGVQNGGVTNGTVTFSWEEDGATATLDDVTFYNSFSIETEGRHVIILTDRAGNSTTYTFEIDLTAPTGTLSGLTNEEFKLSNGTVTFSWNEDGATATLNDEPYTSGTPITAEGSYTVNLKDKAGNSTSYTFEIDKTAPEIFVYNENDLQVNGNNFNYAIKIYWSEEDVTAFLNEKAYTSSELIKENGSYKFVITDLAGNATSFDFIINFIAPTGTFGEAYNFYNDVYYFKSSTSFTWSVNAATATLDGEPYTSGATIRTEGRHVIILRDSAGNSTTYTFEIDFTAPTGIFDGLTNEEFMLSNGTVTFSWEEDGATATLNNEVYKNNSGIRAEGKHTIVLTDIAGNSTTYTFEIDLTAPRLILSGVINEGITNSSVKISWEEANLIVTLNSKKVDNNTTISTNGVYKVILTDRAGNSSTYTFTIDKTVPTGTLEGVQNGGITSKDVYFYWTNEAYTATLNGDNYLSNQKISADGKYEIILSNKAGNTSVYTFEIDKTAPIGTLDGVENEGVTNKNVTFTWEEKYLTATLNNKTYNSGDVISGKGFYTIILTDRAGNSTTYTFEIDKTAPTGTLSGLTNEEFKLSNGTVTFSWEEEGVTATLNNAPYSKGTEITNEGAYTIILTDRAGNSTTYTFEIDLTAPIGKLSNVSDGGITNKNVTFSWEEEGAFVMLNSKDYYYSTFTVKNEGVFIVKLFDRAGNSTTYSFEIDLTAPTGTFNGLTNEEFMLSNGTVTFEWIDSDYVVLLDNEPYERLSEISTEGRHVIILRDSAGNSTTYTFEIDKTAPTGTFNGLTNEEFMLSNGTVTFSWEEEGISATLDGESYLKNSIIKNIGKHTIVLTDRAGNSFSYTFEIDKTAPTGIFDGLTNEQYMLSNGIVTFSWEEEGATATLNSEPYSKGTEITNEGAYTIILTDRAGNSSVYTFEIDKTAPIGTLDGVQSGGITNKTVKFSWTEKYLTVTMKKGDEDKAIRNDDEIKSEGTYTIILTDRAGNSTTYTFEIRKTPPTPSIITNDNDEKIINENGEYLSLGQGFIVKEGPYNVTVNGEAYTFGNMLSADGKYEIVVTDDLGNSLSFTVRVKNGTIATDNENKTIDIILYVVLGIIGVLIITKIIISKTKRKQKLKH